MKAETKGKIALIACIGIIVGPILAIVEVTAISVIGFLLFILSFVILVTLKASEKLLESNVDGIKKLLLGILLYGGAIALSLALFCFLGWTGAVGPQTEGWRAFYTAGALPLLLSGGGSCGTSYLVIFIKL